MMKENFLLRKQCTFENVNDLYAELAFPIQHSTNSIYSKQYIALLRNKSRHIVCFSSVEIDSCKLPNLKSDLVYARESRAVKHSLSSHLTDYFNKFQNITVSTSNKLS